MKKKVIEIEPIKKQIQNARFYGTPGREPVGYLCDGDIKILRKSGESLEELRSRSRNAVEWKDDSTVHVFIPL